MINPFGPRWLDRYLSALKVSLNRGEISNHSYRTLRLEAIKCWREWEKNGTKAK